MEKNTDKEICNLLFLMEYNYSASSAEKRALYDEHVAGCAHCKSIKESRNKAVKRNAVGLMGLGFGLIIGFAFLQVSRNETLPLLLAFGIILFISGVVQRIRGKEPHQK